MGVWLGSGREKRGGKWGCGVLNGKGEVMGRGLEGK